MKKLIVLLLMFSFVALLGACKSADTSRAYDPLSTADPAGTSDASAMQAKNAQDSADAGMVGYSNFESALSDTVYTLDKIPTKNKPLVSSGNSK